MSTPTHIYSRHSSVSFCIGITKCKRIAIDAQNLLRFQSLQKVHAQFIVRSLEIPEEDVAFPPRPLIFIPALLLHVQQKALDLAFEAPEGCTTQEVVRRLAVFESMEEAESVVNCVVATEIVGVLLVALAMMHVQ